MPIMSGEVLTAQRNVIFFSGGGQGHLWELLPWVHFLVMRHLLPSKYLMSTLLERSSLSLLPLQAPFLLFYFRVHQLNINQPSWLFLPAFVFTAFPLRMCVPWHTSGALRDNLTRSITVLHWAAASAWCPPSSPCGYRLPSLAQTHGCHRPALPKGLGTSPQAALFCFLSCWPPAAPVLQAGLSMPSSRQYRTVQLFSQAVI